MTQPTLRALMETGDSYDDPSEDLLFELLVEVDEVSSQWVIVEKVADVSGQSYAQAAKLENGTFQVERRLGSPVSRETASGSDLHSAHHTLTAWAFSL